MLLCEYHAGWHDLWAGALFLGGGCLVLIAAATAAYFVWRVLRPTAL